MSKVYETERVSESHGMVEPDAQLRSINASQRGTIQGRRYKRSYFVKTLKVYDVLALLVAGYTGFYLRFGIDAHISPSEQLFIYLSTIITIVSLNMAGSYSSKPLMSMSNQFSKMFTGCTGAVLTILVCGFMSGMLKEYSRIWIGATFLLAGALLLANRVAVIHWSQRAIARGQLMESIVIVGANARAERMINTILETKNSGINIVGVFDDRIARPILRSLLPRYMGTTDTLLAHIRARRIDRVVVALPWITSDRVDTLLKKFRTVPVRIDLVPNDAVWKFSSIEMERLGGVPIVTFANGRVDDQHGFFKRLEDIVISTLLLLLTSPVLLFVALMVKLDSPGPVFFKQKRHGFNNEEFEVYKFRSMRVDTGSAGNVVQATANDTRVTRFGKFIRRSSLDELPQLFNVLRGEMSIVGPRPHAVQHNDEYANRISEYLARHNVKPGITGWAQVNGLRGETDTPDKMRRRVEFDLYYIEHWSLLLDMKIILMTALTVWFQTTAY
ncbi:MAG: undecaprenyl-phosphate glucose phosphotransferase [Pseudomonadota bacterium]